MLVDNQVVCIRQVKTWFQNRRAKWRRAAPPPPNDNTVADRDTASALRDTEPIPRDTRDTVLVGHKDTVLAGHRENSQLQETRSRVCALASC